MRKRRGQGGFSLIELSIAIVMLGLLIGMIYSFMGPQLKWKSRVETDNRMAMLRTAIEAAYRLNMRSIDADAAARLNLGAAGVVDPVAPNGQGYCVPAANALAAMAQWLRSAPAEAIRDGYGRDFCILIGARQMLAYNGQNLPHHPVAIISGGAQPQVDAGTTFVAGVLTLAGDDVGVVVDVPRLTMDAYTQTTTALSRATTALQQYYAARYQADPSRSPGIDYFGCGAAACPAGAPGNWDAANGLPTTCTGAVDMTVTAMGVLGLTREDVTDGYGQALRYDNCGAGIRSPNNATAAMQIPPFTTAVQTTLPDGTQLIATALGVAY